MVQFLPKLILGGNNKNIDIDKLTQGDKASWDKFVEQYSPIIYTVVRATLYKYTAQPQEQDGQEIVQDVFLRLVQDDYQTLKDFNPSVSSFKTWLSVMARNMTIDFLRRKKITFIPLEETPEPSVQPPPLPTEAVSHPLEHLLSGREKLILQMTFAQNLETAEIAKILGIDSQTVRSLKSKALNKLRKFSG